MQNGKPPSKRKPRKPRKRKAEERMAVKRQAAEGIVVAEPTAKRAKDEPIRVALTSSSCPPVVLSSSCPPAAAFEQKDIASDIGVSNVQPAAEGFKKDDKVILKYRNKKYDAVVVKPLTQECWVMCNDKDFPCEPK